MTALCAFIAFVLGLVLRDVMQRFGHRKLDSYELTAKTEVLTRAWAELRDAIKADKSGLSVSVYQEQRGSYSYNYLQLDYPILVRAFRTERVL